MRHDDGRSSSARTPGRVLAVAVGILILLAVCAGALRRGGAGGEPGPGRVLPSGASGSAWADAASAAAPARIVSLAPSVTETLFALGAGPRVVAASDFCDYPPEVAALPRIGSFLAPSIEAVVGARPDLVIGTPSPGNRAPVETLRGLGVRVEIVEARRLDELPGVIRRIAALAGVPEHGERLLAAMGRETEATRTRTAGAPRRRVLMVVGQSPLVAVGRESFLGDLLEAAGGENVTPAGEAWPHLGLEYVIAADPEVVIDSSMGTEEGAAIRAFWDPLVSVAAVRLGRVHPFRSYRALRPGPRVPEALADLARLIHPERWP